MFPVTRRLLRELQVVFLLQLVVFPNALSFRVIDDHRQLTRWTPNMVLKSASSSSSSSEAANSALKPARILASSTTSEATPNRRRRNYTRKRIPETEVELKNLKVKRQKQYERILASGTPSIWSFESLFPNPVWDEESIAKDLFGVRERDRQTSQESKDKLQRMRSTRAPSLVRVMMQQQVKEDGVGAPLGMSNPLIAALATIGTVNTTQPIFDGVAKVQKSRSHEPKLFEMLTSSLRRWNVTSRATATASAVDRDMTRMVEDRMYGYRRDRQGALFHDSSLMGDGAVQFRNGVRLGNPLKLNADRLNYLAKKELQHGRVEEAVELLELAVQIDSRDGRAYLGLSRCAQRRGDFQLAREYLKAGIANSYETGGTETEPLRGANPYLTQALGCLEEQAGQLALAEELYLKSIKSRPSHAASWVSLAQLRTQKLGQPVSSGRSCYQNAERELKKAGQPPSAYVYTAWAAMEYDKAGDLRRARELFKAALAVDPKCSAAWLQLGVMEANKGNWMDAQGCFEAVLRFDQRNSRVLQAYALMETKRPDGSSRKAIDLFERALTANPRDAGVYQAYALYVAELGDINAARDLLQRGTQVDKRHAPVWQSWGVLETRHGTASAARDVFQQGIWACAQPNGSQSGGYRCARLWQAWGVLEAREGDYAAARRCFSRALDADQRNIAAITAWALMEESQRNIQDARCIFERTLPSFAAGSEAKIALWRTYERMEQRLGNVALAQQVYQRSMREAIMVTDEPQLQYDEPEFQNDSGEERKDISPNEVEVIRWNGGGGEVWLNDRAIEAKVPFDMRKRKGNR
jgi:Tfp pilus assembly protein PilF